MYSNMKNFENIYNGLRIIQQNKNKKLKNDNCKQRTSLKLYSSNFDQILLLTTELAALECLKIDVFTFSRLLLIRYILNLHVRRTYIIVWMSLFQSD